MPYNFKDNGSHIVKPLQRKLYFIIGCLIICRAALDLYLVNRLDIMDYLNIILGVVLIWGVNFNGFYKVARKYMEWKLKHNDNRFDYFRK